MRREQVVDSARLTQESYINATVGIPTLCVLFRAVLDRVSRWQGVRERKRFAMKHGFLRRTRIHVSETESNCDGRYGEASR